MLLMKLLFELIRESIRTKTAQTCRTLFLTHVSVHHDSMLIKRSNWTQQYADIYLLQSLYMFLASQHPSSGALKTVTATSGKGHTVKYKLKIN